jgi:hypothetical protein
MPPAPRGHIRTAIAVLRRLAAASLFGLLVLTVATTPPAWGRPHAQRGHRARGRTFYVSNQGRDSASGRDPAHAWRTVDQVNGALLRPGDTVLFHGGETFSDDTLMPGWGFGASGTAGHPISFGTYGRPRASLPEGIWLGTDAEHPDGPSHLKFANLALGPNQGFQGTANDVKLTGMKIGDLLDASHSELAIITEGSHWTIAHSYIYRTGDSGMLLGASAGWQGAPPGGSHYLVDHNTIVDTGMDPGLTFGTHGIYDKVTDATIRDNRIVGFRDDGVSARYRGARVIGNDIASGGIGIAWYQYDRLPGTVEFIDNRIADTSAAGIFVCGVAESCLRPLGHFVIAHNRLTNAHGSVLNLQPVLGHYTVYKNR